jgi:hypothetical protein
MQKKKERVNSVDYHDTMTYLIVDSFLLFT